MRVADIAAACDVSDKTVYNYFATKEALIVDTEPELTEALENALADLPAAGSAADAFVAVITAAVDDYFTRWAVDTGSFRGLLRFAELIEQSASLRAAQHDMLDNLQRAATRAIAGYSGLRPDDPEPQVAAAAVIAVWQVAFRTLHLEATRHADPARARRAVTRQLHRAASTLGAGLSSLSPAGSRASRRRRE